MSEPSAAASPDAAAPATWNVSSSQSGEECGQEHEIADSWKSVARGTREQTTKPPPANVACVVVGRWTRPVLGWKARIGKVKGQTCPSQPWTSKMSYGSSIAVSRPARFTSSRRGAWSEAGPRSGQTGAPKSRCVYGASIRSCPTSVR